MDGRIQVAALKMINPGGDCTKLPSQQANRRDEARFVSHRGKYHRRNRPALGMLPSEQGFGTHPRTFRIDLPSIAKLELPAGYCLAQFRGRGGADSSAACTDGSKKRRVLRPAVLA